MSAQNRCPSCGGFLFAGGTCAICQSDAGDADDFDLFATGTTDGRNDVSLELENIARLSSAPPGMPSLASPAVPSERPRTITPPPTIRPPNAAVRTDRTSSRPIAGPDAIAAYARFGLPNASPAMHFVYFVSTWGRRQRLAEKVALLRRSARGVAVDLESRYAMLGQALFDEPSEVRRFPDLAPLAEAARQASVALAEIVTTRESVEARSARAADMAASRLERASAALDPIEQVERDARNVLADANARVASEAEALAILERGLREAVDRGQTDADTLGTADREIDAQKARLDTAQKLQRDAALKASDVRRRVLVEASRVAEAAQAVDVARRLGRVENRAQEKSEHEAVERFHRACAELGRAGYDLGAGQTLKGTFWDAKKTRDAYDAVARHADLAENARASFDVDAYVRGRKETIALVAALLAVLGAIAAA